MKKILLIDDDEMNLKSLNRLLIEWEYATDAFLCPSLISQEILNNDYYCAIVDYKLPYSDGIEVLDLLMKHNRNIIPILISGFEIDERLIREAQERYIFFLDKPIKIELLKQIININLEKK
ncbi:MAG: response regulator [Candidatus Cloacimonadales bacterium]